MKMTRIAVLCLGLTLAAGAAVAQAVEDVENTRRSGGPSPFSTVEARRAATPLPFPTYDNAPAPQAGRSGGAPGQRPGQPPAPGAVDDARALYPDQWSLLDSAAPAAAPQGSNFAGTVGTFSQYCENCGGETLDWPQITIGRLFMTAAGGASSCSASVIGRNTIVTAAHCCYDSGAGAYNTDFSFAPAYGNGATPFGLYDWQRVRILRSYRTAPGRANDICLIRTRLESGQHVGDRVGWLGSAWNFDYLQNLHAVGYPGNIGSSETMQLCTAQSARPRAGCARNNVLNMGCSMTYGASGGPWIIGYRNQNLVNSVVSGYDDETCTGEFGTMFNGPRFTTSNFRALCDGFGC